MFELLTNYSYLGIALVLLFGGFMPFPEDVTLLAAGYVCGMAEAKLIYMIPLCVVCVVLGDLLLFLLGMRYGHHVPKIPILSRVLTEKRLAYAERMFNRHGGKAMILARFVPGFRATFFFTAGVFKVPWWKFLLYNLGVAVVTVPIVVWAGDWGARERELVKQLVGDMNLVILAALAVIILGGLGLKHLRQRRREAHARGDAAADDKEGHGAGVRAARLMRASACE